MRKRFMGWSVLITAILVVLAYSVDAQQQRPRGPRPAPPASDLKIRYKMSTSGQPSESVTMIKGTRERSEMHGYGMDNINITQCDLKRTIQLNEKTQKYMITPLVSPDANQPASTGATPSAPAEAPRQGGVLTYITNVTDTGERKEMFGFTARHVKTSLTMKSSPDACNPVNQRRETDGWYIDLSFNFNCNLGAAPAMAHRPVTPGGCRDRVVFRQEGTGRTGYPLIETTTMYGPDGKAVFTSTKEVLELSREPLDAALFDIPQGYSEAASFQELHGMPSAAEQISQAVQGPSNTEKPQTETQNVAGSKQPGTIRVGVVTINNKSNRPVSVEVLRQRLIGGIESSNIDAVPLEAISLTEAELQAKAKQCDYILFTDISGLKLSAAKKLGGFLGRAAGVTGVDKAEARVDYRLFAVGETAPLMQSSATAKEEGDEASVGTALDAEARAVSAEIRKRNK
ncbi:MAG TPA: hypothetical protein VFH31_05960 [Pyrinomonadaceae bacterium]|nr:hypothetical protein [Pyrinomonadaceae bacterium]